MSKKLVAYFSASGVTKNVAERLAKAVGADLFEITPVVPYTHADLNWMDKKSRSTMEMKDLRARPEIAAVPENMGEYDTVFLGFPIWWYVAPRVIDTFVERCGLSGKLVIPFATSGGSGMGKTLSILRPLCPDAQWKDGRVLTNVSDAELTAWASQF